MDDDRLCFLMKQTFSKIVDPPQEKSLLINLMFNSKMKLLVIIILGPTLEDLRHVHLLRHYDSLNVGYLRAIQQVSSLTQPLVRQLKGSFGYRRANHGSTMIINEFKDRVFNLMYFISSTELLSIERVMNTNIF